MIEIKNKKDCVGCNACVQRCPKQCISFKEDEQGFRYPIVNVNACIQCGLCEKVCPVINQAESAIPDGVYAAKNRDDFIKEHSSSGGIFYALAENIIEQGGVVFGAKFNETWEVEHGFAEDIKGLKAFMTSKYVQSYVGETFRQTEEFLKKGKKVLYSGTPCQIAALKLFLRKEYGSQLITVDFVCHGVPSPKVWRDYLQYLLHPKDAASQNSDFQSTLYGSKATIVAINFRDKRLGWSKYGFSVHAVARKGDQNTDFQSYHDKKEVIELLFEPHSENLYMQGFLKDLYLRPSCYACPAKCGKSHSDITLADFWGVQTVLPEQYDNKGVSLILCNSQVGTEILKQRQIKYVSSSYEDACRCNPALIRSAKYSKWVKSFWSQYPLKNIDTIEEIIKKIRPSFQSKVKKAIRYVVKIMIKPN